MGKKTKQKPVDDLIFDGVSEHDTQLAVNMLDDGNVQLCIVDPARGDGPAYTLSREQQLALSEYLRTLQLPG